MNTIIDNQGNNIPFKVIFIFLLLKHSLTMYYPSIKYRKQQQNNVAMFRVIVIAYWFECTYKRYFSMARAILKAAV